ncbi:hypothetical protein CsatB_005614 [Cannabis sativa]|uniref:Uncharacterized protein n=1 Tax=Cannabis sativa TaxID=3483 RepID=A0A803NR81_CANSA
MLSDQQPEEHTHRCKNVPPPTTGLLSALPSTGDIAPVQRNVLASTAVDRQSGNGADEGASNTYGDTRALGCLDNKADISGFELSESLGFESSVIMRSVNLNDDSYRAVLEGLPPSSRSILKPRNETAMSERIVRRNSIGSGLENLPPFLSSMDEFGRPRYVLERVRSDGRLKIFMGKNKQRRGVVRTPSLDGETTTRLMLPYTSPDQ